VIGCRPDAPRSSYTNNLVYTRALVLLNGLQSYLRQNISYAQFRRLLFGSYISWPPAHCDWLLIRALEIFFINNKNLKKNNNTNNNNNNNNNTKNTQLAQTSSRPKCKPKVIRDSKPDFRSNPDTDMDVCRIAPKMLWIHCWPVGVSQLAKFRKNRLVTMRNAVSPKNPYSTMEKKMEKWSRIHMLIEINIKN